MTCGAGKGFKGKKPTKRSEDAGLAFEPSPWQCGQYRRVAKISSLPLGIKSGLDLYADFGLIL
jgi:hypothetical protein